MVMPMAGPVLTQVAMSVLNALTKLTPVVKNLITQLPLIAERLRPIAEVFLELNKLKGQFTQVNSTEEFAARVEQSEVEKHRDIDSLIDEIAQTPASPEAKLHTDKMDDKQKFEPATVVLVAALVKEYGSSIIDLALLTSRNPVFFNATRLDAYLSLVDKGNVSLAKITDYFASNLSAKESQLVENKLLLAEQDLQALNSEDEIKTQLQKECE